MAISIKSSYLGKWGGGGLSDRGVGQQCAKCFFSPLGFKNEKSYFAILDD